MANDPATADTELPQAAVRVRCDWTEEGRLAAIASSAQVLVTAVLRCPGGTGGGDPPPAVWSLREAVWPATCLPEHVAAADVELALTPLSRLGQMEGKSGSLVLIGQFSAAGCPPSHNLVVKSRPSGPAVAGGLRDEYTAALAVKPYAYDRKDSFAFPVWFDAARDGYDLLWSTVMLTARPAEADGGAGGGGGPAANLDMRALLGANPRGGDADDPAEAERTIEQAYRLLRNLHRRCGWATADPPRRPRPVGDEYNWYLRGYSPEPGKGRWGHRWAADCWAAPATRVLAGGGGRVNPLWVVDQVLGQSWPMRLGVVHGDLHPGNIILRPGELPAVIDFGWAAPLGHLAKDFVLMECNLRFLSLRPQFGDDHVRPFAAWVGWAAPRPELTADLGRRSDLIECVRRQAAEVLGADTDWDREYLAPLYLTAFGLLRFGPQIGHQRAAILFIEALAAHLAHTLKL